MRRREKTMKHVVLALLVAGVAGEARANKVDTVVVYADRAEVTRVADAACPKGEVDVAFEGLPRGLDDRTLRADADGKAKALGVKSRVVPLEANLDERVAGLQKELQAVNDKIGALDDEVNTLSEAAATVGWVRQLLHRPLERRDSKPQARHPTLEGDPRRPPGRRPEGRQGDPGSGSEASRVGPGPEPASAPHQSLPPQHRQRGPQRPGGRGLHRAVEGPRAALLRSAGGDLEARVRPAVHSLREGQGRAGQG